MTQLKPVPPASAPAATPEPVIAATEDHPAIYRDGHRLTATRPAATPEPMRDILDHIPHYAPGPSGRGDPNGMQRHAAGSYVRLDDIEHALVSYPPAATTGGEAEPLSVDRLLFRLEEEMHCHLDQPLRGDFMSLTRGWRDILTPLTAQSSELAALRALVRDLSDDDDCQLDHHGYCQTHGWMTVDTPCPQQRARAALTEPTP